MGVLIIAEQPPVTSPYDQWKVYRATSKTGEYGSAIVTQNVTDLSYYDADGTSTSWYKISYYDSSTPAESSLSDPIQGQSTHYTTVKKVESLLQMSTISDSTNPNVQEVVDVINRMEDEIDSCTGHAWRIRYSNTASGQDTASNYEYYDISTAHEYQSGRPIYLRHRKIRDFDADEGDALQFFDGSSWIDWLSTKTEGRNNDYWVDYDRGILYIRSYFYVKKPLGLRIKYRYGELSLNREIENICTKMVAMDILTGMDPRSVIVQEGSPAMTHNQRVDRWEREVNEKLQRYKEWQVPIVDQ